MSTPSGAHHPQPISSATAATSANLTTPAAGASDRSPRASASLLASSDHSPDATNISAVNPSSVADDAADAVAANAHGLSHVAADSQERDAGAAEKGVIAALPELSAPTADLAPVSVPPLRDSSIASFAEYLRKHICRKLVVLVGAGMSTAAGIPDFRSPGTGLYANLEKYRLPFPEAVFHLKYFMRKPQPFFQLARELFPGQFQPTLAHAFIRLLADEGMLLRCYTQNIDGLERVAGVSDSLLVEAHGSFNSATCVGRGYDIEPDVEWVLFPHLNPRNWFDDEDWARDLIRGVPPSAPPNPSSDLDGPTEPTGFQPGCGRSHSQDWMREQIARADAPLPPLCQHCRQGIVKPDITFFGESLPSRFFDLALPDLSATADAVIVIGSSLSVHPFAGLLQLPDSSVPRLLINRDPVYIGPAAGSAAFDFADDVVGSSDPDSPAATGAAATLRPHARRRDAAFLGSCDDGCRELARLLGLEEKLDAVMADLRRSNGASASPPVPLPPADAPVPPAQSEDQASPSLDPLVRDLTL
ncbi:NAD-dependent protein deacetylase sirtuin-2 [Cladochytrium tenue]|nr:NAD-dependent protein deacetylase sirtuin-2 [Cladochytrium tenue]